MDPHLLRYYNQELVHLREMGAEFATQFPKIASRLRLDGIEVADPYVERLLEGFAFLTARIQLKLDAEFPRFTNRLLEVLHPHFLAPIPSMLIAQLTPLHGDAALTKGVLVPRGSAMRSEAPRGTTTACRFMTAHDMELWPAEIVSVSYFAHAANLPTGDAPALRKYGGGVRIKLRTTGGLDFSQLACRDLRLCCSGIDDVAYRLHELLCGQALGVLVMSGRSHETLPADAIVPVGFDDEHALLPTSLQGFEGYRLMQEYFAFPHRFLFFDVKGVGQALKRLGGHEAEIVILLARGDGTLQQAVDTSSLSMHCVPAINLFEHRCDRIHIAPDSRDLHVVPDRTRPTDFEIHQLTKVTGYGSSLESERVFWPLYAAFHTEDRGAAASSHTTAPSLAYYALQREPRVLSSAQQRDGPRSSYIGSEMFISIVDPNEAPFDADLQQLGVSAICSNRDLPLLMALGSGKTDLALDLAAPVASIRVVKGPSRPLSAQRDGNSAWRLVNHLSLNHLSLIDADQGEGAAALREMLRLYTHGSDASLHKQIDGLRAVRSRPVVRRLTMPGPIAFGRGVEIEIEVDEMAFQGASAFLLGCVLERFMARHVSMNGFTQTTVKSQTRGEILKGKPRCGSRPIL
ncbi:type VI secretion system baseplate subunit TssF [soil metagenome]